MDFTLISYKIVQLTVTYNFILFAIWLIMVKRSGGVISHIYIIIMTLFVTRLYGSSMAMRARDLRDMGASNAEYINYMSGVWWETRTLPESIVFIILAVVLTNRFVRSYFFNDPRYRAEQGRRKTDNGNDDIRN